jgi:hypothetical protein
VWGVQRVVPVMLSGFTISEESYDPALNPISAKVSLDLRVLSYSDLPADHVGYYLFLAHQTAKEALARLGMAPGLASELPIGI